MTHANYSFSALSQWAEVPADEKGFIPSLYNADGNNNNKDTRSSLVAVHSGLRLPAGRPHRTIKSVRQSMEELRQCKEDNQLVWVYLTRHVPAGYHAKYDGVHCFIPNIYWMCKYTRHAAEKSLEGTWCQASIHSFRGDNFVIVSVKKYLEAQFQQEVACQREHLQPGMTLAGVVQEVRQNGFTVNCNHIMGLLPMNEVIPVHLLAYKHELKQRFQILKSIFILGRPLEVMVDAINENGTLALKWDKKLATNAAICDALCTMGTRC